MTGRFDAPGLARHPCYTHAAASSGNRLVLTAGAVPLDVDGNLVGEGDRVVRTHQVLDNPGLALEVAPGVSPGGALEVVGAGWEGVPKTTVYVAPEDRRDLADVWGVVQGSPVAPAASTLIGVSVLGYEGQLVEIEAIAVSD